MNKENSFTLHVRTPMQTVNEKLTADIKEGRVGGFLVIVDDEQKVVGTITDSDIRRSRAIQTNEKLFAKDIMNQDFIFAHDYQTSQDKGKFILSQLERRTIKNDFPISYIPVLNAKKSLVSLLHISTIFPILDTLTREIIIIGQGFVGLTLSMALVDNGIDVIAIERDELTFKEIDSLRPRVFEPRLQEILKLNFGSRYKLSNTPVRNIPRRSFLGRRTYIVAVGTPKRGSDIDLEQLSSAVLEIAQTLKFGDMLIIRSTVPIGYTRDLADFIFKSTGFKAGSDFYLAYAPERTVEGNAIVEMTRLPQLVAGFSDSCSRNAITFFSSWIPSVVSMESLEACEMAKLLSNAFRDVSFAFANEAAIIASEHNIDINRLINSANMGYGRNSIPQPSPGVGGPCLTKDSYMIRRTETNSVIFAGRKINEDMVTFSANRIAEFGSDFGNLILVIGVAFKGKPATNDLRNSPSIDIIHELESKGFQVVVMDSVCSKEEFDRFGLVSFGSSKLIPRIICILNNHADNSEKFKDYLLSQEINRIHTFMLFDPWDIIAIDDFKQFKIRKITLSKNVTSEN